MKVGRALIALAIAVVGTLAIAMILSSTGFATVYNVASFYPSSFAWSFGFQGTSDADDLIIVWGAYPIPHHIEDAGGVSVIGEGCHQDTPTSVTCRAYAGRYRAGLEAGDDRVVFSGKPVGGKIDTGEGSDMISGASGADKIHGSQGEDQINGGPGDDLLDGGPDADVLRGTTGDDTLRAQDGIRDTLINCGPGDDFARIDRGIDPRPLHCETVLRIG